MVAVPMLSGCNRILGIADLPPSPDAASPDAVTVDSALDAAEAGDAMIVDAPGVCPTNYALQFGTSRYLITSGDNADFSTARAACIADDTHLVVIDSAEEDAALPGNSRWIGLRQPTGGGDFVWVTGAPVTYQGWEPGQPNGGTNENCTNRQSGGWNDVRCSDLHAYICECDDTRDVGSL